MKTVATKDIRPTQLTHGLREIHRKTEFYKLLSGPDLDMAIAEKPIPIVLGPAAAPFAIDHHHVAAALHDVGIKGVPAVLVADFSRLSYQEFSLSMEDRRWTYPYDAKGRRKSFAEMPAHVWELKDDEFRSLAASVRDAGGYEKTTVPLEEFRWAGFFRTYSPSPQSERISQTFSNGPLSLQIAKLLRGYPGS